ncbi:STAS/SEC14 domain-containing protein [Tersicoccus phoenicis]|uniref:STAS/SEC14 domain-containing protein n=1 Tax=Tersicoccus phoenicis TaxID=554083 RepID=A0A1R1L632_9MICC|nr:STAS/SEC14 domain-containing protein [Tersicoccus phoenicis]OMH22988.1 STAS/SEC14 domain-containing protein [Tersicoccus phoenicis]
MAERAVDGTGPDADITRLDFDDDGVLHLVWRDGVAIDGVRARRAMDRVNERCGVRPAPLMIHMAGTASVDRAARQVFTQRCAATAIALLGASAVDRVLANFFLGVNAAPCPTRFFRAREQAQVWLLEVAPTTGPDHDG